VLRATQSPMACVRWVGHDTENLTLIVTRGAQVVGSKRVVLYPPCAAPWLYVQGSSSRVEDVHHPDLDSFPLFSQAPGRIECSLHPGAVLVRA
jgi:hypothetical protein